MGTRGPRDSGNGRPPVSRSSGPGSVYLGIVHRLDRPTSGVILWAKTEKAARRLATQFQNRRAVKEYWAIVESPLPISARSILFRASQPRRAARPHVWNDWLTRPDKSGRVSAVAPNTPVHERPSHACASVTPCSPGRLLLAAALARNRPHPPVAHPGFPQRNTNPGRHELRRQSAASAPGPHSATCSIAHDQTPHERSTNRARGPRSGLVGRYRYHPARVGERRNE